MLSSDILDKAVWLKITKGAFVTEAGINVILGKTIGSSKLRGLSASDFCLKNSSWFIISESQYNESPFLVNAVSSGNIVDSTNVAFVWNAKMCLVNFSILSDLFLK